MPLIILNFFERHVNLICWIIAISLLTKREEYLHKMSFPLRRQYESEIMFANVLVNSHESGAQFVASA